MPQRCISRLPGSEYIPVLWKQPPAAGQTNKQQRTRHQRPIERREMLRVKETMMENWARNMSKGEKGDRETSTSFHKPDMFQDTLVSWVCYSESIHVTQRTHICKVQSRPGSKHNV